MHDLGLPTIDGWIDRWIDRWLDTWINRYIGKRSIGKIDRIG